MKHYTATFLTLSSLLLASCNQAGTYTSIDGNRSQSVGTGQRDSASGAIIKQELDEFGNLRDCGIGSSAKRLKLPDCNEVVERRVSAARREKEKRKLENKKQKEYSDQLFTNKLAGKRLFTLPNGAKVRVKTRVLYNDEFNSLIVNAIVERVNATESVFQNIFLGKTGMISLSFLDGDEFEFLDSIEIPLNIEKGQMENITFRKKIGTNSELIGMKITARKPIRSLREYEQIDRIDVSFRH